MSAPRYQINVDGQEVQVADFNLFAAAAARSEDWAFAELLRLAPLTGGAVAKAILPYNYYGSSNALVAPNGATGSVLVNPFRVIVGPRTALGATTSDPSLDTTTQLAWRDARSAVYAVSDNGSTFGHAVPLSTGDPSNGRWTLIYANYSVDVASALMTRFTKAPGQAQGLPISVAGNITQSIIIATVFGTASATPVFPAVPADNLGLGIFNVPLAYVWTPANFNAASGTVATSYIATVAPTVPLSASAGVAGLQPMQAASGLVGTAATNIQQTWGAAGTRVDGCIPSNMTGGASRIFNVQANGSAPYQDTNIVDASIDWRNRYFRVWTTWAANTTTVFPSNADVSLGQFIPGSSAAVFGSWMSGQSFVSDDAAVWSITTRAGAVVATLLQGGHIVGLYVDRNTGNMRLFINGDTTKRVQFWVEASGQFDNR